MGLKGKRRFLWFPVSSTACENNGGGRTYLSPKRVVESGEHGQRLGSGTVQQPAGSSALMSGRDPVPRSELTNFSSSMRPGRGRHQRHSAVTVQSPVFPYKWPFLEGIILLLSSPEGSSKGRQCPEGQQYCAVPCGSLRSCFKIPIHPTAQLS